MISLNNISNKIEILYDDHNQHWFKRAHVGKFLGIINWIHLSIKKLAEEDIKERQNIYISTCVRHSGWKGD